jgi:superfamily I DNA/RNA helicase
LTSCYRSTAEIGAAASAWAPDPDRAPVTYRRHGPRPVAIPVANAVEATTTIHDYIRAATRTLRIPLGSCAVLIPTNDVGHDLEHRLGKLGMPAKFSSGQALDLAGSALKILTYHSAKGLEFPVVALYDYTPAALATAAGSEAGEQAEREILERRVRYVAMTRAMQALAVVRLAPDGALPDGLDGPAWRPGPPADWAEWLLSAGGAESRTAV